ncbi:DUF6850 family outer membrane beta-barrel protein [Pedobacter montanisoli]|uniref:DUF6850 domain-containing protein n=1 Tax=Pedobacter montanisoli TaxID=2923277 RepID=A0ABS9ZYH0_9SPHI|nr:DUF6850 family outer membrane beta-barrel protein [Pedobacter montanisoli]MCJ0743340.1 hypothetical protein [Pedobacter montanisoli]
MKKFITICFVLLSVKGFAQSLTDSLYLYQQSGNILSAAQQNANFLLVTPVNRSGKINLDYDYSNGGLRRAQQAQTTHQAGLVSEGFNKFGRFETTGYFRFSRIWQDSLSWTTKGLEQDDQPYYYGSIKAGSYERFRYELGGILSYNLIKDKIYLATGLNYLYNSATRSVDPRPQVNTYQFQIKPEVLYRLSKSVIGINALWGYGTETMGIAYKNIGYRGGGYPDRVNYFVQGYGYYTKSQNESPLKRLDKQYGLGLTYTTSFADYHLKAAASYKTILEDNYKDLDQSVRKSYVSFYDTEKYDIFLQLDKQDKKTQQQLQLTYNQQQSNDVNIVFYAINYKYSAKNFNLQYLIRLDHSNYANEFGLNVNYNHLNKQDVATQHHLQYVLFEPNVLYNAYLNFKNKDRLKLGLQLGYRTPLQNELSVDPLQINIFTHDVIFPDYQFYSSNTVKTSVSVHYVTANLFKNFRSAITASADYYRQLSVKNQLTDYNFNQIGKDFISCNLGLNIYF